MGPMKTAMNKTPCRVCKKLLWRKKEKWRGECLNEPHQILQLTIRNRTCILLESFARKRGMRLAIVAEKSGANTKGNQKYHYKIVGENLNRLALQPSLGYSYEEAKERLLSIWTLRLETTE